MELSIQGLRQIPELLLWKEEALVRLRLQIERTKARSYPGTVQRGKFSRRKVLAPFAAAPQPRGGVFTLDRSAQNGAHAGAQFAAGGMIRMSDF